MENFWKWAETGRPLACEGGVQAAGDAIWAYI